jgi:uncharacterized protein
MSQLYVLVCEDKPDHLALREQNLDGHLRYLETQTSVTLLHSGVTLDYELGTANGSIIIVSADDLKHVGDFVARDPFTLAGLYKEVKIKRWDCQMKVPAVGG